MPDPTYEAGVRDERARVVRWLREEAGKLAALNDPDDLIARFVVQNWHDIARAIEAGEHEEARDGGQ